MDLFLAKILAVVLALSQVTTRPDAVKTQFEQSDRVEVVALLRAGCGHVRKVFELEDLQLDDLVETAMADPQSFAGDIKGFKGVNFADLNVAYRQFCKNEDGVSGAIDIDPIIAFYNSSTADLPDHTRLKGTRLPDVTVVLDAKGERVSELYEAGNRRVWVPFAEIPERVRQAFVAAEDKRFFQHKGIDERGLVRAFVANMMRVGRPQGGSTITQQVVKNLLVGDDVTYERKIREIILASRLEHTLSKEEILELYLNMIYLGRNSWGVEMAARSYFGKPVKDLDMVEAALIAGLTKGPNYYNPDRSPDRARERLAYVLERLQEDGILGADEAKRLQSRWPSFAAYDRSRDAGHFFDYLGREAKALPALQLKSAAYTVRSTIDPALQSAAEAALQEGLAQYETNSGRASFQGPEANLTEAIRTLPAAAAAAPPLVPPAPAAQAARPGQAAPSRAMQVAPPAPPAAPRAWQQALSSLRLPLADVHWEPAVVVEKPSGKKDATSLKVGLRDGRVLPLRAQADIARKLVVDDVVYVRLRAEKTKAGARAELRVRPLVQGAAVVLDNKTGRILAMAGAFSYSLSQLNRTAQTRRQPGSAIKPLTYLAALQQGLQPNTLIRDEPITLPPINGSMREQDYWTPKNYDGSIGGVTTLRRALENSRNLATVGLLDGPISASPQHSLDRVCELMVEAQLYTECQRYYPIVLGAQPVRLIDLAAFYAAVANEGGRPTPHAIERVEQDGRVVWRDDAKPLTWLGGADRVSFYQLKTMLQGVVARGTAASISRLAPYVAGKTGTSDDENDAWFAGFTNDVTIAVWVGYDNANAKERRTLGGGATGGHVAVPIFEQIAKAVWASYAPQVALSPPSADAKRQLAALPIDLHSGERTTPGDRGTFYEQFRLDGRGKLNDTQYHVIGPDEALALREQQMMRAEQENFDRSQNTYGNNGPSFFGGLFGRPYPDRPAPPPYPYRGLFGQPQQPQQPYDQRYSGDRRYGEPRPRTLEEQRYYEEAERARQRRVDPDYFWNSRRYN